MPEHLIFLCLDFASIDFKPQYPMNEY
jgi:hypothetical protein